MNRSRVWLQRVLLGIVCLVCIGLIRLIEYISGRTYIFLDIAAFGAQFPHLARLNELGSLMCHGATFRGIVTVLFSEVQAAPYLTENFIQALRNGKVPIVVVESPSLAYRMLLPLFKIRNRLLLNCSLDLAIPGLFGQEQHRINQLVLNLPSRNIYSPWLWPRNNEVNNLFRSLNIRTLDDYLVVGHRTGAFKVEQARASGNRRILDIDKTQEFRNTSTADLALAVEAILDSRLKVIWVGTFDSNFFENPHICRIRRSIGIVDLTAAPMARLQGFIFKHARGAFLGGVGGMCELAWAFGIPVAVVNWVPYTSLCASRDVSLRTINPWLVRNGDVNFPRALDSTFVTLKRIVRKDSGTRLTLRDSLQESLFSESLYALRNLTVIDNSPAEITNAAIEFLRYLTTSSSMRIFFDDEMQSEWRRILFENLGQGRLGQAGRPLMLPEVERPMTPRESLCYATVSPNFIANNVDLLN